MKVTINKTIVYEPSPNDARSKLAYENIVVSDPAAVLVDGFLMKNFEHKVLVLENGNSFSEDIFGIIDTPKEKISYVEIYCYNSTSTEDKDPKKFDVKIGGTVLARVSTFELIDVESNTIADLTIEGIVPPVNETYNLVILVGNQEAN